MPLLFLFPTEATKDSYMPLLFLPSARLTVDIHLEEVVAPMHDGALVLPHMNVEAIERVPRIALALSAKPIALASFPGRTRHAWAWFPYGLYDAATVLGDYIQDWLPGDGGVYPDSPRWLSTRWLSLLSPSDMGDSE